MSYIPKKDMLESHSEGRMSKQNKQTNKLNKAAKQLIYIDFGYKLWEEFVR